jgi:polyferredoxin
MRLDPLAMLAQLLASRTFLAGSTLALLTVGLTLVFGRAWCGWLCPQGTVLDLFSFRRGRASRQPPPESTRAVKHGLLLAILSAALFANLSLMVLDPLTLLYRTLATSVWPAVDRLVIAAETALYRIPILHPLLSGFDRLVRPSVLPTAPVFYRGVLVYAGVFVAVVALNLWAERFWCRYLCPLGGLLGLLSKVALVRREVGGQCTECGLCARSCPTGTIEKAKGYASDPAECTMCLECLETCQRGDVRFPLHLGMADWNRYDPSRRQALTVLAATAGGIALLGSDLVARRNGAHLIRPPGAHEERLLSQCLRCGECIHVCPTAALQPALTEAGLEGLWTPMLLPRLGYCDYACNACGQVCPVQAIPPLSLEEKRLQVIGRAHIDRNRCIPWADYGSCIVCEEMCPLPEKAISLDTYEGPNALGDPVSVQRPQVIAERCIGCGICEYKCPAAGEAAIRVYAPAAGPLF